MGRMQKEVDQQTFRYIIAALRRIWRWSRERRLALDKAKVDGKYKCASCKSLFERKDVAVDHIKPVINPAKGWQGFSVYIKRLWCPMKNLQVICKPDHKVKSVGENKLRKKAA